MRHLLAVGVLAVCGFALLAQAPKDKDKVKDEDVILGSWKIEKYETNEELPPKDELNKVRLHFKKDGVMEIAVGTDVPLEKGTYKLDPTAKPKNIDMIDDGDKTLGIYELDGDTLKMCVNKDGENAVRPTEFKVVGKKQALVTFKRVKDEPKK